MGDTTNIILAAAAFISIAVGIFLYHRRKLLVIFVSIGVVLFLVPFVRNWYFTRDSYEWTIIVKRDLGDNPDPVVIFVDRIEWITDYPVLKRQRGHVGNLTLNARTTGKVWHVRGYTPLEIRAEFMRGMDETGVTRMFSDLSPGEYTFTLSFDTKNDGHWSIEPGGSDG